MESKAYYLICLVCFLFQIYLVESILLKSNAIFVRNVTLKLQLYQRLSRLFVFANPDSGFPGFF